MTGIEAKFGKSAGNRRTENAGLLLLLEDPRFQVLDTATKRHAIQLLPVSGAFGHQTFDAVMAPAPIEPLTIANIGHFLADLTLIEMKTTKKPIRSKALNGFFFGATEREYEMAAALGSRYKFAFVVLNDDNVYGRPFYELLSLPEVEERTRAKRIQYQVNFRTDMDEPLDGRASLVAEAPAPFGAGS